MSKWIYKNDGSVHLWTQEIAAQCEIENRELPENQRHVEFETETPTFYKWVDGKVIEKTFDEKLADGLIPLVDLKKTKTDEVNALCESKILSGFWSSATGVNRHYQAENEDQMNLVSAVTSGMDMLYKCGVQVESEQGFVISYGFVSHTAEQLKQVLLDGANIKSALLQNAYLLKTGIADATTQVELLAIDINVGWIQ